MNNEDENLDEHVVQPGENQDELIISIHVNQYGESRLGVNRDAIPVEILYFYLQFMANALIARHQQQIAEEYVQRKSNELVVPSQKLFVAR